MQTNPRVLYLHIGTHKTGTTALQRFFAKNQTNFAKSGIGYPQTSRVGHRGHYQLVSSIRLREHPSVIPEKSFDAYLQDLSAELSANPISLISSEMFCEEIDLDALRRIKSLAPTVRIIVYLRRQDSYVESIYVQRVKMGRLAKRLNVQNLVNAVPNYGELLERWGGIFGKANLLVRVYEKEQLTSANIFTDALEALGVDKRSIVAWERPDGAYANASFGRDELEFMRLVNALPLIESSRRRLIGPLLKMSALNGAARPFQPLGLLTPDERAELLTEYAQVNAFVAQEYLGRKNATLFHAPLPGARDWREYAGLSADAARQIVASLAAKLPETLNELGESIRAALSADDPEAASAARQLSAII